MSAGRKPKLALIATFALPGFAAVAAWLGEQVKPEHLPPLLHKPAQHPIKSLIALGVIAFVVWLVSKAVGGRQAGTAADQPTVEITPTLRAQLLALLKVRIRRRIDDSLQHQVRVQLGLRDLPVAVVPGWTRIGEPEERPIPTEATPASLFDQAGGRLLILGEPGGGKTTWALDLAAELIERAIRDADGRAAIPVFLNLATWSKHGGSIRSWLEEELETATDVNRALARALVHGNRLLVLFDGLDEVREERRGACVEALNDYLGERSEPAVVCSRITEYAAASTKLHLQQAIRIEPLDLDEVERSLATHPEAAGVRDALRNDPLMRELTATPLMLSVALLTYMGGSVPALADRLPGAREAQLWDDYIVRMLRRRPAAGIRLPPVAARTLTWLSWLGRQMKVSDMTSFVLDRMQAGWLARPRWFRINVIMAYVVVTASVGVSLGTLSGGRGAVIGAAICGLLGIASGINRTADLIEPPERLSWSWRAAIAHLKLNFVVTALTVALTALAVQAPYMLAGLTVTCLFVLSVSDGIVPTLLDSRRRPGDRLRQSLRNALFSGAVQALIGVGLLGLLVSIPYGAGIGLLNWIRAAMPVALLAIFINGGDAVLMHYLLRAQLVREGVAPWRYVEFLEYATASLLLHNDDGVIRFRHILLRNHVAALTPDRIEALAARVSR